MNRRPSSGRHREHELLDALGVALRVADRHVRAEGVPAEHQPLVPLRRPPGLEATRQELLDLRADVKVILTPPRIFH